MKYIYTLLLMLICGNSAFAVDLLKNNYYNFITVPYVSVDGDNNPIVLSVNISYPTVSSKNKTPAPVDFIVLYNHPTICADYQSPSGERPLDAGEIVPHGAMRLMTTEGAMVIACDYIGWGYSRDKVHPYCNHTLTAKNVIDGFVAAMDTAKARGIQIADDYYTINAGYSQGGSVSMAVQKYLETTATEEEVNKVRLKKSICGAGPYDLELTYAKLAACDTLSYPCCIALTLEGLKAAYNEGPMRQVDLDSIYISHDFHVKLDSVFNEKETTDTIINKWICNYFNKKYINIYDMLRPEIMAHQGAAAKGMDKALSYCNMLDGSWMPKTPMTLFQYTKDEVVPFENSLNAVKVFGDKVKLYTEKDNIQCKSAAMAMMLQQMGADPKTHLDYGTYFIIYFLDGILRDL